MKSSKSRRGFIKNSVKVAAGIPMVSGMLPFIGQDNSIVKLESANSIQLADTSKSIIGDYGRWAASLVKKPALMSLRNDNWSDTKLWREQSVAKTTEVLAPPLIDVSPKVTVINKLVYDGLDIEELSWKLPYGRATKAFLLKPQGAKKPLPAILALHDHGGNKYFGKRKIVQTSDEQHSEIVKHQQRLYAEKPWANEIAKRGYVVLVHDVFSFASRRVLYQDIKGISWGEAKVNDKTDENPELEENIHLYNKWAAAHEHIVAKSLFCAGTTWPGVVLAEDKIALDILSSRTDVDSSRIGCGGLSGGGLRTVYLGGLDERINCAVCVGFMSTWNDFLQKKSFAHTWMTYAPLLPNYLDFPEILGLRAPLPTLVLNNRNDSIFTFSEMEKSDSILKEVYAKVGAKDNYKTNFYDGGHKFDAEMQSHAFDWFDQWL